MSTSWDGSRQLTGVKEAGTIQENQWLDVHTCLRLTEGTTLHLCCMHSIIPAALRMQYRIHRPARVRLPKSC